MTTDNVIDMHREVSIQLLKSLSCFAVRVPRGQKDPGHYGWDPKTNTLEKSRQTIHKLETGDDNLGAHLFGATVDVDVDTDNPFLIEALDYFLPSTPHAWGRGERKRTHRLYELAANFEGGFDPSQFPFLKTLAKHDDIKVEIRGGEAKSGQYSLLPGSLHPSGQPYEWDDLKSARSSPVAADLYRIVNGVRFACVAALVAPHWTEGNRNNLCMAFSGFLHRAASHVEDMGSMSPLFFEKKDALEILEAVMRIADDDPADRNMRIRTFEKTWDKADSGVPVQGASTLAKITGNPHIIQIFYSLLADTPDLIAFDEFLDRYAVRNGTSNVIDIEKAGSRNSNFLMTVNDFRNSNMHKTIVTGSGERRQMCNILLSSTRAIRVDGLCFIPGGEKIVEKEGATFINQWIGFDIKPWEEEVSEAEVQPFVDYIKKIVANGHDESFSWIMSWIADIFQYPATKSGTALVLVGMPGAGKSILGEKIIRKIIGSNHSMQTNAIESLTGTFNSDSSNMLFVQCDEASNSRRKADANKLKSMITDSTRRVEPKNVNAYQLEDCSRYMFTSNEVNDAIAIVDGQFDRRYGVFQVNNEYSAGSRAHVDTYKRKFWEKLHAWLDDRENLSKVHRYLIDRKYDRAEIRKPLDTEARRTIQQHSQRGFDDWLMGILAFEHPLENMNDRDQRLEESYVKKGKSLVPSFEEWPEFISYRRLEDSYEQYRRKRGMSATTPAYNAQQIKQEFVNRGMIPFEAATARVDHTYEKWENGESKQFKKKIRVTQFPSREAIAAYLKEFLGYEVKHHEHDVEFGEAEKPHEEF